MACPHVSICEPEPVRAPAVGQVEPEDSGHRHGAGGLTEVHGEPGRTAPGALGQPPVA